MKRIVSVLLVVLLLAFPTFNVFALTSAPNIVLSKTGLTTPNYYQIKNDTQNSFSKIIPTNSQNKRINIFLVVNNKNLTNKLNSAIQLATQNGTLTDEMKVVFISNDEKIKALNEKYLLNEVQIKRLTLDNSTYIKNKDIEALKKNNAAINELFSQQNNILGQINVLLVDSLAQFNKSTVLVDKTALSTAIEKAKQIVVIAIVPVPESYLKLQQALTIATKVYNNPLATQADVDMATKNLYVAIDACTNPPQPAVDKTALSTAIEKAKQIVVFAIVPVPESYLKLQQALAIATKVYNNPLATQADVDMATKNLYVAIDACTDTVTKINVTP